MNGQMRQIGVAVFVAVAVVGGCGTRPADRGPVPYPGSSRAPPRHVYRGGDFGDPGVIASISPQFPSYGT